MKWLAGAAIYLLMATVTYGAMNATNQYYCHNKLTHTCDARMVLENRAEQIMFAALPPTWISAFFITNLYADGFSYHAFPHIRE